MMQGHFDLPLFYQVIAIFALAITGAMVGIEKKYDFSGVFIIAFVTGASGAIIRDGVFLDQIPVIVKDWQYIVAIAIASLITPLFITYIKKINIVFIAIDALGLGIFGIIATQMAMQANLHFLSAIFIGLISAISGGLLRDVLTSNKPLLLIPGQYYFTAVLAGIILFVLLGTYLDINAQYSAIVGIITVFMIRILSYKLNLHTSPAGNLSKKFK